MGLLTDLGKMYANPQMSFIDKVKNTLYGGFNAANNTISQPYNKINQQVQQYKQTLPQNERSGLTAGIKALPDVARITANNVFSQIPIVNQVTQYVGNRMVAPAFGIPSEGVKSYESFKKGDVLGGVTHGGMAGLNTLYTVANLKNPLDTQLGTYGKGFLAWDSLKSLIQKTRSGDRSFFNPVLEGLTGKNQVGLGNAVTDNPQLAGAINTVELAASLLYPAVEGLRGKQNSINKFKLNAQKETPHFEKPMSNKMIESIYDLQHKVATDGQMINQDRNVVNSLLKTYSNLTDEQILKLGNKGALNKLNNIVDVSENFNKQFNVAESSFTIKDKNIYKERLKAIKEGKSTIMSPDEIQAKYPAGKPLLKVEGSPLKKQIVNAFAIQGDKTFNLEKTKAIDYVIEVLGEKKVKQILRESGMNTGGDRSITRFWNLVKPELAGKRPNWKQEWQIANETLVQPSTPQGGVKPIKIKPETKVKVQKPIMQDIEEFGTVHPPKETVVGPQAEVAYKNLKSHADSLTDRITNGIKHYKITQEQFTKYIQNPETAPIEIKPIIDAHRRLMEIAHSTRENPNLGQLQNYFPHIGEESINLPSGIKNIGKDLWISDFNIEVGSAKTRTGKMTDYSTDYNKVMKNYFDQVAYEKYGKRIQYTPKVAEFVKKVETHLTPDAEGMYKPPSNEFDYVAESAIKQEVKQKTPIFSKMEPLDTFDSLKRKFSNEKNGSSIARTMEEVRDMRDKIGGMELKLEKMGVKEQIDYLASNLTYNKGKLKDILLKGTNNGTTPLPQSRIVALLRAEKNYRLQNFIDEVGKYEFGKQTQDYLNTEIDRLMKSGKYESSLLDKVVNFVTGTFYKAQIWGNLNTGIAQKGESLRIPPLYGKEGVMDVATGMKNDMMTGGDILKRYDFSGVETDISKQLDSVKPGLFSQVDKQASKVGNVFVNIGENSKNRDFLYAAEGQGKRMGLQGKELYTFVRNELFANGFILHEFNTPQMLKNPLVRLFFQYQQYNIKLFNRVLEMAGQGEKGKALGVVGSQAAAAVALAVITGKGIETVKDRLFGAPVGPGISLPIQMGTLIKEIYDAKKKEEEIGKSSSYITQKNTKKLTDLTLRNTIPFANQFYKSKGAIDVLQQGYDTQPDGNVTYLAPTNPVSIAQGVAFGKSSFDTNRDYYNSGGRALGDNQTALFKQGADKKQVYANIMDERKKDQIDTNMREQVKQSGQSVSTADYFYYKADNGDVKKVDKNFQPKEPVLTGNTELDKKLISKYKGDITAKANDIVELYSNGQLTKEQAEKGLTELKALTNKFATAKKPKKVSSKKITAPKVSVSNIKSKKLPSIKIAKQPKMKAFKIKKSKSLLTSADKKFNMKIKV